MDLPTWRVRYAVVDGARLRAPLPAFVKGVRPRGRPRKDAAGMTGQGE
jgi:hypothetical protein